MLNSVDLPQPEGPMQATNSPGMTLNETWSTATTAAGPSPNCLDTLSMTSCGSVAPVVRAVREEGVDHLAFDHHAALGAKAGAAYEVVDHDVSKPEVLVPI